MTMLPDQQMIPGQCPISINHQFALTVEDFSVQRSRPVSVATGFAGNFGKRVGVAQYTFSYTMPPLANGYEVPLAVLSQPHSITYLVGNQEFTLDGCDLSSDDLTVAMAAGTTGSKFSGNALKRTPA